MKYFLRIRFCSARSFHTFPLNARKLEVPWQETDNTESNIWKYVIYINTVTGSLFSKLQKTDRTWNSFKLKRPLCLQNSDFKFSHQIASLRPQLGKFIVLSIKRIIASFSLLILKYEDWTNNFIVNIFNFSDFEIRSNKVDSLLILKQRRYINSNFISFCF